MMIAFTTVVVPLLALVGVLALLTWFFAGRGEPADPDEDLLDLALEAIDEEFQSIVQAEVRAYYGKRTGGEGNLSLDRAALLELRAKLDSARSVHVLARDAVQDIFK